MSDLVEQLRSDAEIYREIARFRGVVDTPLGRALLHAAERYDGAGHMTIPVVAVCVSDIRPLFAALRAQPPGS